jgi:hypothetical protein
MGIGGAEDDDENTGDNKFDMVLVKCSVSDAAMERKLVGGHVETNPHMDCSCWLPVFENSEQMLHVASRNNWEVEKAKNHDGECCYPC